MLTISLKQKSNLYLDKVNQISSNIGPDSIKIIKYKKLKQLIKLI